MTVAQKRTFAQRIAAAAHAFARWSVGLAGLVGFGLTFGIGAIAWADARAGSALIASVLVLALTAAVWRPSLLPAVAAFFGGALLLVLAVWIWMTQFAPWP